MYSLSSNGCTCRIARNVFHDLFSCCSEEHTATIESMRPQKGKEKEAVLRIPADGRSTAPIREKSKRQTKRPSKYLAYTPPSENKPRTDKVHGTSLHIGTDFPVDLHRFSCMEMLYFCAVKSRHNWNMNL